MPRGDRGEDVKELQRRINAAGYTPPLVVDGIWGPKTDAGNTWLAEHEADGTSDSSSTTPTVDPGGQKRYTDGDARFNGLAGNPEIWYNTDTDESYVIYFVPGTEPPIPAFWTIDKEEHLQAYFGDAEIVYDRALSSEDMTAAGALSQGINTELIDRDGDPMAEITDRIERDMEVRPYLADPEIAAIIMASALEGVAPDAAQFQGTQWWKDHTAGERSWLLASASDPATAQQAMEANRLNIKAMLEQAGVYNPPEELVNYIADQQTMGHWTAQDVTEQINIVSDPAYNGVLDTGLGEVIDSITEGGTSIDTNTDQEKWVRETALKWLGPQFGTLTDEQVSDIAGRIRNDPDYSDTWIAGLQNQRVAMFPAYTDPLSSYDDIAQPWRSVYHSTLGVTADENSEMFQQIVQQNDLAVSRQQLREYGIRTSNEKVTNEALGSLAREFNGGVRRIV